MSEPTPGYPLNLTLSAPALVVIVGLEGPTDVAIVGNRGEASGLKAWIEGDPVRRALLVLALIAAGHDIDDDRGDE